MKGNKRGISLIVLVITIVVVIILAAVMIANLTNNTDGARKARFFHDMSTLDDGVHLAYTSKYAHNPDIAREEAIQNKGELSQKEKEGIEKIPTLEKSIRLVTGIEDVKTRRLYWLDTEGIGAEVTNKKARYMIDMDNLVIYDYDGKEFFGERWHTIRFGVEVKKDEETEDEDDGWIRLVLEYPEGSTERKYRISKPGEERSDPNLEWKDYTGPILVRASESKNVWIKYKLDNEEIIKPPMGVLLVYIDPDVKKPDMAEIIKVNIKYDQDAQIKQYQLGDSGWLEYKGEFEVTENVVIKARAYKTVVDKDENGNITSVIEFSGKDTYRIDNITKKESDETLEAPKIEKKEANDDTEKARVEIKYPEDKGNIRKVYKINSGIEQEYTGSISIKNWGEEVLGYYYTEDGRKSRVARLTIKENEENLDIEIYVTPDPMIDKTASSAVVEIEYDKMAVSKRYKIDSGIVQDYTGPITVKENCTITAYGTTSDGKTGSKTKVIKFSEKEIEEPIISEQISADKKKATISIEYPGKSVSKKYKIISPDGTESNLEEYEGEFEVTEDGTVIYAVSENIAGQRKDATHTVYLSMIRPVINVTVNSNKTEASISISYDSSAIRKSYMIKDENGNVIKGKTNYTGAFKVKENRCKIIAEEENERGIIITEEKIVNMDMVEPVITQETRVEGESKTAIIRIKYDEGATKRKYKIISPKGIETDLKEYEGEFEVIENETVIYAEEENERGEIKDATYTVKIGLDDAKIISKIIVDSQNRDVAEVEIIYDVTAITRTYRINGGEEKEYTGKIIVDRHLTKVEAIQKNNEGQTNITEKIIEIEVKMPDIMLEINEEDKSEGIVTINYQENAVIKDYIIDEGLGQGEIREAYTGPILVKVNGTKIKAITENSAGDSKTSEEFIVSGLEEKSGIRFIEPVIYGSIENGVGEGKVERISINYDKTAIRKEYKIISPNGQEGNMTNYENPFVVVENGTVIYAEEEDSNGNVKGATYTVSGVIENIEINIIADPDGVEKVDKVKIKIEYGSKATSRRYKISGEAEKDYVGEFYVDRNCTITAIGKGQNAQGKEIKVIGNLSNGIKDPVINIVKKKEENGQYAEVKITYDSESINNTYSIDGNTGVQYTGEFEVRENGTKVEAISVDKFGNVSKSEKVINLTRYVIIDKGGYVIVKLTYPEGSTNNEYKYKADGVWKKYPEKYGFALIKDEYQNELLKDNIEVKLEADDGTIQSFKGHYYIYNGILNADEIFMRWDEKEIAKEKPWLVPLNQAPKETVEIAAIYPANAVKKEYKIGATGNWIDYTGPITIGKNYTTVYARATFADGDTSQSSYAVRNLQIPEPEGDIEITYSPQGYAKEVEITIKYMPKYQNLINRYKVTNQAWVETINNEVKFKIQKNATIYASYKNANGNISSSTMLKITNIDNTAPSISIMRLSERITGAKNIQYKVTVVDNIGGSGIYVEESKYVLSKQSVAYSENDSIWDTASHMTSNPQNVILDATSGSGKYYLHVLGVDRAGNKITKKSGYVDVDSDPPNDATITFDYTTVAMGESVNASVVFDLDADKNISKYIYSTTSTKYGEESSVWNNASTFEGTTSIASGKKIKLTANSEGTYYLHVLSIDKVGNRKETVSSAVSVRRDDTIYISPSGSDSGNGSRSNPYRTYSKAINSVSSGGKICFMAGRHQLSGETLKTGSSGVVLGIYDYGKAVDIYGENENTVIVFDAKSTYGRDGNAVALRNSSSKLRNLIYEFYPKYYKGTTGFRGAIFAATSGTIYNVYFKVYNTYGTYNASMYYGSNTEMATYKGGRAYNCSFYYDDKPVKSWDNMGSNSRFTLYSCLANYVVSSANDASTPIQGTTSTLSSMKSSSYGIYNGTYAWPK